MAPSDHCCIIATGLGCGTIDQLDCFGNNTQQGEIISE